MAWGGMLPELGMIRGRPNPRHLTLTRRLKLARAALKMTRSRLALTAGLSNPAVRLIEEGGVPGVDTVERLARVLGISAGWLAYAPSDATPMEPAPPREEGAALRCAPLGERLLRLREERGLSRNALGKLTQTTDTTIRLTEEGRTMPSVATVEQIATGLGVSPAWLAYGEGPQVLPRAPRRRKTVKEAPPRSDEADR